MHAVVVSVTINDREAATKFLHDELVPQVKQVPGFVAGHWVLIEGERGRATIVFDTEDAALAVAERVKQSVPDAATLDSAEVGEVVASA